jgi:hypothetical protein
MREIRERVQVIALMRLYRARWRPWDPEGPRARRPSRQLEPRKAGKNRTRSCPNVAPQGSFRDEDTLQPNT